MEPIDLDAPPVTRNRGRGKPWFVLALLVTAALTALVTHTVESRRRQTADNARLSLTALVTPSNSGGTSDGHTATMQGTLAVANSGPLAVLLDSLGGTVDGVSVRADGSATVRPGVKLVPVTVTFDCDTAITAEPLEVVMNVRTADGQARVASSLVAVQGTYWAEEHEMMCGALIIDPRTGAIVSD